MDDRSNHDERWRAVPGFEGWYEVSDHGNVRSVPRLVANHSGFTKLVKGRPLRPRWSGGPESDPDSRLAVGLSRDGRRQNIKVHILVLTAFVGPRPPGMVGCHNDDDRLNNHLVNLRWDTQSENIKDIVRAGRHHLASRPGCMRGHKLVEPNLYPKIRGRGACKACAAGSNRVRAAARRGICLDLQSVCDEQYRRIMDGRFAQVPTACKRGHQFCPGNVKVGGRGRKCRACSNTTKYNTAYGTRMTEAEFQAAADARYRKYTSEERSDDRARGLAEEGADS